MKFETMWIWWAITIALCGWKLIEGLVVPRKMLEWPFLASGMWAYFYGYMAREAKLNLPGYLANGMSNIGQLMPLLCLIALYLGWALGNRSEGRRFTKPQNYAYVWIWLAGMFFLSLGAAGGFAVRAEIDSRTINFSTSSGYWYLLFYVGYPGLALAMWSLFKMKRGYRLYLWIITLAVMAAFMAPHVLNARRGPLFPAIMVLLLLPSMTLRRAPNRLVYVGGLAAAGLVMLLFLQLRPIIYSGGTYLDAVKSVSVEKAFVERSKDPSDNEYINNCQLIATIYHTGKYEYGTGYFGLMLHWVPRAIWHDKPVLGEGIYTFDELFDDVEAQTGFRLLGTGASSGGVADTFVQYGVLCPVFWFAVSWGFGWIYARFRREKSPRWLFCYVGVMCASHWLVSQGLGAALVPCAYFQVVPAVVFLVFRPLRPVETHRRKMSRPASAPAPIPRPALS